MALPCASPQTEDDGFGRIKRCQEQLPEFRIGWEASADGCCDAQKVYVHAQTYTHMHTRICT